MTNDWVLLAHYCVCRVNKDYGFVLYIKWLHTDNYEQLTQWVSCNDGVRWNAGISSAREIDSRHSELICSTFKYIFHCIICVCGKEESEKSVALRQH